MERTGTPSQPRFELSYQLPSWMLAQTHELSEADAAFNAGCALKTLDDVIRSAPVWGGCWRQRQALSCAVSATRLFGRAIQDTALRDAVLLTASDDDPGPDGRVFVAFTKLIAQTRPVRSTTLVELCALLELSTDELEPIIELYETARQAGKAVPFVIASFISSSMVLRPDAESLIWWLADKILSEKLNWSDPLPLLMATRFGPAFHSRTGRGRIVSADPAFSRALCLALINGTQSALQTASLCARRAEMLLTVAPKLRSKSSEVIIQQLLNKDAILATAPGCNLSRWASRRLFDRLESLKAVRELSGRTTFRIYGL